MVEQILIICRKGRETQILQKDMLIDVLLVMALLLKGINGELYCPGNAVDMNDESGDNVEFVNGGWTMSGGARVSSKTSFNLLGGYIEFDMDVSKVSPEVNTNFYTTSPAEPNCGSECYCDIQRSSSGNPSCMELDLLENNGRCLLATTLHTFATDGQPNNQNCDRWGCQSRLFLPSNGTFSVRSRVVKRRNSTFTHTLFNRYVRSSHATVM